jgi:hypothetical protein
VHGRPPLGRLGFIKSMPLEGLAAPHHHGGGCLFYVCVVCCSLSCHCHSPYVEKYQNLTCNCTIKSIVEALWSAQSGLAGSHSGDSYVMLILGMSSSSNLSLLGQRTLKQLITLHSSSGMCSVASGSIGSSNSMACTRSSGLRTQNLGYAALHGAYQMVVHQVAMDCLVGDQDVHLASDWVIICNGTRDNREFYGAKHSGKA